MTLLGLLQQKAGVARSRILGAALVVGLSNVLVMSALNRSFRQDESSGPGLFFVFLLGAALFITVARYTGEQGAQLVERVVYDMRIRMTEKIRRAELAGIESIGVAEIRDQMTEKLKILSHGTERLVWLPQFAVMAVFNALYLATISPAASLLTCVIFGAGLAVVYLRGRKLKQDMRRGAEVRHGFATALGDLLGGFKEIRLRRRRGEEIGREIETLAGSLKQSSLRVHVLLNDDAVYALSTRYALLGVAALVLPMYFALDAEDTHDFVAGLLFFWAPILAIVNIYPMFMRASLAADSIAALERKLDEAAYLLPAGTARSDPWGGRFTTITTSQLQFEYTLGKDDPFRIGPIDLTLAAGEIVLIVGGNGAGKSTLLKLLTGLYLPSAGSILVDGVAVGPENIEAYREMIAAVLADSHLFSELYGLEGVQDDVVSALLRKLQLDHDVSCANGRLSRLNLSTGQRKRVALLVALLEDRPLMAFDEWAADQDPEYRRRFYEEILPDLKRRGKSVFVVTHDDRYFHLADRIVRLSAGKLREPAETSGAATKR
jgi:putative ATP-binding cassette transporter